jgi:hypothetical protein
MTEVRVAPPEPVELVSAEVVEALVARTRQELALLERELADANAAADATEARALAEGADERSTNWTMVQLQRFLNGLRDKLDLEVQAISEVAHHRAERRVAEAHAQAELMMRLATEDAAAPSVQPVPDARELAWADRYADLPEATTPLSSAPAPIPQPEPKFLPVTPIVATAAPVVVAPPLVAVPAMALYEPPAPPPAAPDATTEFPVPPAPVIDAGGFTDPMSSGPDATVAGADFWTQAEAPKRKGLRRIPLAAVLQVLAVLLILVIILLRLS